ncbi:hypothetical protein [Streptomyces sp. NPDC059649]|uniref:hypothetical protein n=1 Tax=Streptomyces sp. NPDC059649 TaxID=3346895 RepID=UPI00368A191C
MSTLTIPTALTPDSGGGIGQPVRDALGIARTALIRTKRAPSLIPFVRIQPIAAVLRTLAVRKHQRPLP